ncbi:MAG: class I SAM-dependent methyltransferase [Anaerolineales bacterium]
MTKQKESLPRDLCIKMGFKRQEFDFFFQCIAGSQTYGGAEVGDIFCAAAQIKGGDEGDGTRAWDALAERVEARSERAREEIALDIQNEMLAQTRARAETAGLTNIRYLQAELGQGDLPLDTFDRIVLVSVLGEMPHQAALQELYAALKPGGILLITEVIFDPHFQGRESVRRLAEDAGFTEKAFLGKRLAYTMHALEPAEGHTLERDAAQ